MYYYSNTKEIFKAMEYNNGMPHKSVYDIISCCNLNMDNNSSWDDFFKIINIRIPNQSYMLDWLYKCQQNSYNKHYIEKKTLLDY